jgi:hypothetical protein
MRKPSYILLIMMLATGCHENSRFDTCIETNIEFSTTDSILYDLYHHAVNKASWNLTAFGN